MFRSCCFNALHANHGKKPICVRYCKIVCIQGGYPRYSRHAHIILLHTSCIVWQPSLLHQGSPTNKSVVAGSPNNRNLQEPRRGAWLWSWFCFGVLLMYFYVFLSLGISKIYTSWYYPMMPSSCHQTEAKDIDEEAGIAARILQACHTAPPALFLCRSRRWSAKPDNDLKVRGNMLNQRALWISFKLW